MSLFLGVYLDMALAYSIRGFDPISCDAFSRRLIYNALLGTCTEGDQAHCCNHAE